MRNVKLLLDKLEEVFPTGLDTPLHGITLNGKNLEVWVYGGAMVSIFNSDSDLDDSVEDIVEEIRRSAEEFSRDGLEWHLPENRFSPKRHAHPGIAISGLGFQMADGLSPKAITLWLMSLPHQEVMEVWGFINDLAQTISSEMRKHVNN